MKGIFRLSTFKDISVVSGCGVGGGSLGYANTLYVPPKAFFEDPQWGEMEDWHSVLAPHYAEAQRMLGVTQNPHDDPADQLLRELGEELGVGDTYQKTPVGVYFGEPGKTVPDPFFGGEGPDRTGCMLCGRCMVGCPHGAKNTLVKNYLYFAEKRGAKVTPERTVIDIRPIGPADGSEGYEVESVRSGAWLRKERRVQRARGVVLSAGPLGTNKLLQRCPPGRIAAADLPPPGGARAHQLRVDPHGDGARGLPGRPRQTRRDHLIDLPGPAHAHRDRAPTATPGDSMQAFYTLLVGDGTRVTRPLKLLAQVVLHPAQARPGGVLQALVAAHDHHPGDADARQRDRAAARAKGRSASFWLSTEQDAERPNPSFIPVANEAAEWFAKRTGGIAQSAVTEALFNIPTTAHILGGAVIAPDPEHGVIDAHQRVFGYENLLVCDGSAVPANVGVNPSLTITALAEHAMSHVPAAGAPNAFTGAETPLGEPVPAATTA